MAVLWFPTHTLWNSVSGIVGALDLFLPNLFGDLSFVVAVFELLLRTLCSSLSALLDVLMLPFHTVRWLFLSFFFPLY